MRIYQSPEIRITVFALDEIFVASIGNTEKSKPTGGGGGVVLPDDDWT